jgi:hypothetical protein
MGVRQEVEVGCSERCFLRSRRLPEIYGVTEGKYRAVL